MELRAVAIRIDRAGVRHRGSQAEGFQHIRSLRQPLRLDAQELSPESRKVAEDPEIGRPLRQLDIELACDASLDEEAHPAHRRAVFHWQVEVALGHPHLAHGHLFLSTVAASGGVTRTSTFTTRTGCPARRLISARALPSKATPGTE